MIRHMLNPVRYRRKDLTPSWDAAEKLESYFPTFFHYGKGGPTTLKCRLGDWVKHALSVYNSVFSKDLDFIFFTHAVLRRKRLNGLTFHGYLRNKVSNELVNIRKMLQNERESASIISKIDSLLRSGSLNVSFEKVKSTPAFWAALKSKAWAYLVRFGPCQIFLTMSVADILDPYLFLQINPNLTLDEARSLSTKDRAQLLAANPIAATTIFHRRVDALFQNFLFGRTRPFGNIVDYLGRVEQQERKSPQLHLLIWLEYKAPVITGNGEEDSKAIADFVELFSTAILPPDELLSEDQIPPPSQTFPVPIYQRTSEQPKKVMTGAERYAVLSKPIEKRALDVSMEQNALLRAQMIATQSHDCVTNRSYCSPNNSPCRFNMPYPLQQRSSIAWHSRDDRDKRMIALCPRSCSYLNSTHPMLQAMCHSNTDVTLCYGSSIAQASYVCNYVAKAEKVTLFNKRSLSRLRKLLDSDIDDDRTLLSAIAKTSESIRTVGAQEACGNLLNEELVFESAAVLKVWTHFLLAEDKSIEDPFNNSRLMPVEDVLDSVEADGYVAVPRRKKLIFDNRSNHNRLHDIYMQRPSKLEDLSLSQFFEKYEIRTLRTNEKYFDPSMVLYTNFEAQEERKICKLLKMNNNTTSITRFVTIPMRGNADESSPYFAAAALVLHVPFRCAQDLLQGDTLIHRLEHFLKTNEYPELNIYVKSCQELTDAAYSISKHSATATSRDDVLHEDVNEDENSQSEVDLLNNDEDDNEGSFDRSLEYSGLELTSQKYIAPDNIPKAWTQVSQIPSGTVLNRDIYNSYLNNCRNFGLSYAAGKLPLEMKTCGLDDSTFQVNTIECKSETNTDNMDYDIENVSNLSKSQVKKNILSLCKTSDQKEWLQSVLSHLDIFYTTSPTKEIPKNLQDICLSNPVIFTNAPGGTGKSWMLQQLRKYPDLCIPLNVSSLCEREQAGNTEYFTCTEQSWSRFGKMVIFTPSGVSASNASGSTLQNGLRVSIIKKEHISPDRCLAYMYSEATILALRKDFETVRLIVIDEFSMMDIVLIAFLDWVLRRIRIHMRNIPFGGIPIILTGDSFQLPPVNGLSLLSELQKVPHELLSAFQHCTTNVFYLKLQKSVRQSKDSAFEELLSRIRLAMATGEDAKVLNQRVVNDFENLIPELRTTPILSAKNITVQASNDISIS